MVSLALDEAAALEGRLSRTARSRLAICEACIDLIQEGALQPSADEIAKRAGVSRRSIFNHFADLAELYDAVVEVGMRRCAPLLVEIPRDLGVGRRIELLIEARTDFLEATGMFTMALTAQALVGSASEQAVRVSQNALQRQHEEVEHLFGGELRALSESARTEVLDSISAALAPLLWETMRRIRGHSIVRARAILRRTLAAILRDAGVAA